MCHVFYSPAYVLAGYEFDTTRKAGWVAASLLSAPIEGVELVEPRPLTAKQVAGVHSAAYIKALRTGRPRQLAESQGFSWDSSLWPMVLATNGGVVAAALSAMKHGVAGSLSSGLHHARHATGAGFCTLNGLVIAAHAALNAGAESVLILDLDAHSGGGTASLISDEERILHLDISVDGYDRYDGTERIRREYVSSPPEYLATVERCLAELDCKALDLCLYNAGMDPHEDCAIGGRPGITGEVLATREAMVFEWCRQRSLPIAFAHAGGYVSPGFNQDTLVSLHRLTIRSAGACITPRAH